VLPPEVIASVVAVVVCPCAATEAAAKSAAGRKREVKVARNDVPDERGLDEHGPVENGCDKNRMNAPAALKNIGEPRTLGLDVRPKFLSFPV
jgi:hypothetical protein